MVASPISGETRFQRPGRGSTAQAPEVAGATMSPTPTPAGATRSDGVLVVAVGSTAGADVASSADLRGDYEPAVAAGASLRNRSCNSNVSLGLRMRFSAAAWMA